MTWASGTAAREPGTPAGRLRLVLAVSLAILPALVLLASVGRTPGFISDSVQYAAAADSLQRGFGLSTPLAPDFDAQFDSTGHLIPRHRLTQWPPGYPLAIAFAARLFNLPASQAALAVNAAAVVTMLVFVFLTIRKSSSWSATLRFCVSCSS